MSFPFDLGFIPGTQSTDGDPLDVLVLMDAPVYPGCNPRQLKDLDGGLLDQIEAFFGDYNRLRGRRFEAIARRGPRTARRLIEEARIG